MAAAVGVKKEDVTVNVTLLGGGFGRKSFPDFIVEAAVLSKKTGKPVKVVWSREDDIKFDSFHSVAAMYFKATLGANGMPTAWLQRSVFPPIASTFDVTAQYADAGEMGWDSAMCHSRFRISAQKTVRRRRIRGSGGCVRWRIFITRSAFIRSWANVRTRPGKIKWNTCWRCWDRTAIIPKTRIAKGLHKLRCELGQYPLDTARFRRVVQLAAEKSGWGKKKLGNGFGMGIAVHRSFLTYVATVVQAEVKDGQVVVRQVDTAMDAGTIVNPTTVRQQFEGAAVMGTSIAFYGEITRDQWRDGPIEFRHFSGGADERCAEGDECPYRRERRASGRSRRAGRCRRLRRRCITRFSRHGKAASRDAIVEAGLGVGISCWRAKII